MGMKQSKRSVDITSTTAACKVNGSAAPEQNGKSPDEKLKQIAEPEDKPQMNGSAEKKSVSNGGCGTDDHKPEPEPEAELNCNGKDTKEAPDADPPTADDDDGKKVVKDKRKKKFSMRSFSFTKKKSTKENGDVKKEAEPADDVKPEPADKDTTHTQHTDHTDQTTADQKEPVEQHQLDKADTEEATITKTTKAEEETPAEATMTPVKEVLAEVKEVSSVEAPMPVAHSPQPEVGSCGADQKPEVVSSEPAEEESHKTLELSETAELELPPPPPPVEEELPQHHEEEEEAPLPTDQLPVVVAAVDEAGDGPVEDKAALVHAHDAAQGHEASGSAE